MSFSSGASIRIPEHVLEQALARPYSAHGTLGQEAFAEACKGLSRELKTNDPFDLEHFAQQLRDNGKTAVERNYESVVADSVVFAVSYVHHDTPIGKFKFSELQWADLKVFLVQLSHSGVKKVRLWYDQCLRLRDLSQRSWAPIGILPYAIWPVISLGAKRFCSADRTIATQERFWPFFEELAALWGIGLFVTRELRSAQGEMLYSLRSFSYNIRAELEPNEALAMVLLNVFHGATDGLKTTCIGDVDELKDMARWNVLFGNSAAVVVVDWREKLGMERADPERLVQKLVVPEHGLHEAAKEVKFLDGSRKVSHGKKWCGVSEFLSENVFNYLTEDAEYKEAFDNLEWFKVVINKRNEYQLMRLKNNDNSNLSRSLWLVVAMKGRSANFRFGSVKWTKVCVGPSTCSLRRTLENGNMESLKGILRENVLEDVTQMCVTSVRKIEGNWKPAWNVLFPVASASGNAAVEKSQSSEDNHLDSSGLSQNAVIASTVGTHTEDATQIDVALVKTWNVKLPKAPVSGIVDAKKSQPGDSSVNSSGSSTPAGSMRVISPEELYWKAVSMESNDCNTEAMDLFLEAGMRGHLSAMVAYGHTQIGLDYRKAVSWLRAAAERNHPTAWTELGQMFARGHGVERSNRFAVECWKRGSALGCNAARSCIGLSFVQGFGVEKDPNRGISMVKQIANCGHVTSMRNLSWLYRTGRVGPKNIELAAYWDARAQYLDESAGKSGSNQRRLHLPPLSSFKAKDGAV